MGSTPEEIENIQEAEYAFQTDFFYYKKKKPINFFFNNRNKEAVLESFLRKEGFSANEEKFVFNESTFYNLNLDKEYIDYYKKSDDYKEAELERKRQYIVSTPGSPLDLYAYGIGGDKKSYMKLSSHENPIDSIKNNYPNYLQEEMDIFHAEPLFSWLLERSSDFIESLKKPLISQDNEILYILGYLYTERQTCPSCEYILERTAYNNYIPLIAFKDTFDPDFIISGSVRMPFPQNTKGLRKNIRYPYTLYKNIPDFFTLEMFQIIKSYNRPSDLQTVPLSPEKNISLREKIERCEKEIEDTENYIQIQEEMLKVARQAHEKIPVPGDNEVLVSISGVQSTLITLLERTLEREEKGLKDKRTKLIRHKRTSDKYLSMLTLREKIQRLPLQYKIED